MKSAIVFLALVAVAGCKSSDSDVALSRGKSDQKENEQHATLGKKSAIKIALDDLDARSKPKLAITSPAFAAGSPIPATYSDYGEKSSPPLNIAGVPANARSLLIIADDPDATNPKPFVHWLLYNVPPDRLELRTALPGTGQIRELMNAKQGMNSFGTTGYFGPHPPMNDPPHHYHFQAFALDAMLPLEQAAKKSEVIAAAKGHVLAAGELVGTFQKKSP